MRTLIVGCGTVGTNLARELSSLPSEPDMYDKYVTARDGTVAHDGRSGRYDFAFICVDTPRTDGDPCDISEVRNAIAETDAEVYVIKSTVLPGTTDMLREETGKRIVFSPEYYGATQHANGHAGRLEYDFTILGGDRGDCAAVVQLLQHVYDGSHQFRITDARTAELTKYMENCWIATKVSFCNQFYDIAGECGVSYEELRELFVLDPRVSPYHTFAYEDDRGWDSHCLSKDVPAIAGTTHAPFLDAVIGYNDMLRREHKM